MQLNIDSQHFDCQMFVKDFLKTHSVQDLIKKHNELSTEIKDYDQEIQTLVFENYSKFISSIDTVKKMKTDITKVEEKMKGLSQSMDKISHLSKKIDSSLSTKREEIIKLDIVNKDLSKLNNVCDFPHIIQKELDQYYKSNSKIKNFDEFFSDTALYYKQCFQMLEKYKNEGLIQPIYKESMQKLEQVRQILWSALMEFKLQNPLLQLYQADLKVTISTQEARSAVKKLIYIMEDEEAVIKHYQKIIKERYLAITKELIDKSTIKLSSNSESINQVDVELFKFIEEKKYEYNIQELEDYKLKKEKEYVTNDSIQQGSILWLINQLCQIIFRELKVEVTFLLIEVKAVLRDKSHEFVAEQCIKEIIHGVLQGLTEKMNHKKINNIQVNEVFRKLQTELQSLFQNNSNIRPQLKTEILDKFSENVENICRGQVLTSFVQLRLSFLQNYSKIKSDLCKLQEQTYKADSELVDLEGDVKREIMNCITQTKQQIMAQVTITLIDLKAFVFQQQEGYLKEQSTYLNLIQASLIDYCKFISQILTIKPHQLSQELLTTLAFPLVTSEKQYSQNVIQLVLNDDCVYNYVFINQFLILYQKTLITKITSQMLEVFPGCGVRPLSETDLGKLNQIMTNSIKKNLMNFASCQSEQWLKKHFRYLNKGCQEFNMSLSPCVKDFVYSVKNLLLCLGLLFPDQKRGLVKKQSIAKQDSGFNIEMEIVMIRKVRSIEMNENRSQILLSSVKYFLKVLLERVRRMQQMVEFKQFQLDLYFVCQLFYELISVDEEGLICGFYLDLIENGNMKSGDKQKLDQKQVEQVCNQFRSEMKL